MKAMGLLRDDPRVRTVSTYGTALRVDAKAGTSGEDLVRSVLAPHDVQVRGLRMVAPGLEDLFSMLTQEDAARAPD
jgi:hypothetical protein